MIEGGLDVGEIPDLHLLEIMLAADMVAADAMAAAAMHHARAPKPARLRN